MERKQVTYGSKFDMEHRRKYLWASEAPRIVGAQQGRYDLWAQKAEGAPAPDLSGIEAVQMGHVMQRTILGLFNDQTGLSFMDAGDTFEVSSDYEFLAAHTDGLTITESAILEIKNFNQSRRSQFGDWGSADVPVTVAAQCIHEAIAFGVEHVYVAVLFGGQEFVAYKLTPSDHERTVYADRAAAFWESIQTKTPPEPLDSDEVLALWPRDSGETVSADSRLSGVVHDLKLVREKLKDLETEEKMLTEDIKLALRGASALVDSTGKPLVTWKASADGFAFDPKAFQQDHPDLYKKYTLSRPGSRRFLVK
jgi:predicted phage-related endonuclease